MKQATQSTKITNSEYLEKVILIISDTNVFISNKIKDGAKLKEPLIIFNFLLSLQVIVLVTLLNSIGLDLKSAFHFAFSELLLIPFLALAGHISLIICKVDSNYKEVMCATLYLYGVHLVIVSIAICTYTFHLIEQTFSSAIVVYIPIFLSFVWLYRGWSSVCSFYDETKRVTRITFVLSVLIFIPFSIMFQKLSYIFGSTIPM